MLKPQPANPNAPDQVAPKLFKPDSFAMRLKALADELFLDDRWRDMYSQIGRTARSPKQMTIALILQRHKDLSDRAMEEATRYDLEVKAALGLAWDDPGIPSSSISDFRARLLQYGRECEAFNAFNQMLVGQGLIKKREALIVDASHMEANAAAHNPRLLIRKATQAVLRQVRKERPKLYNELTKAIELTPETKFSSGPEYFLLPDAERNERFAKAVREARVLVEKLDRQKLSPTIKAGLGILEVILDERSTDVDEPIDPDDAPPDRITSHRDPDARWGAKGKDKYFHGYKRTILTTKEHGFIANVDVVPGNATDSTPLEAMLEDSQEVFGLEPEKVIGDAAYGSLANHRRLKVMGIQMVASLKPAPNPKGRYSRDRFSYDPNKKSLSCPGGQTTREAYLSADGEGLTYRFATHQCGPCKLREECTRGDFRSVKVGETVKDLDAAIAYGKTDEYKADMKLRPVIEGKHSELVRYHGGRRTPYWSLPRVFAGEVWRCLAVNIKRWAKVTANSPIPATI